MAMLFTDSVSENEEVVRELISNMPPGAKARAQHACKMFDTLFFAIRKENPKDPAIILGTMGFIMKHAATLAKAGEAADSGGNLIELLD